MNRGAPGGWRGVGAAVALAAAVGVLALTLGTRGTARPPGPSPSESSSPSRAAPTSTPPASIAGPAPGARTLTASAILGGRTVVTGGLAEDGGSAAPLEDTWELAAGRWSELATGPSALARSGAVLVGDGVPARRLVLVGGRPATDSWTWDGRSWTRLGAGLAAGLAAVAAAPLAGGGAVLVAQDGSGAPSTWRLEGDTWSRVATTTPPVRLMAYDPSSASVVALAAAPSSSPGPAATWRFDGTSWRSQGAVVEVEITAMLASDPRSGRLLLVEEDFRDETGDHGGTWSWDGARWQRLSATAPPVVFAFDVTQPLWATVQGHAALVGGPRVGDTYRDIWVWDGATQTWSHLSPG